MNKKGLLKIVFVLVILVVILLWASVYFIGKQKDLVEEQAIELPQAQNQEVPSAENNEPVQEQAPIPIPTGGITGDIGSSSTAAAPSGGGSGGGGGGGGSAPDDGSSIEPPEEPEENITLPPECIYERNSKLPECYPE
jgi:hypothetical protein